MLVVVHRDIPCRSQLLSIAGHFETASIVWQQQCSGNLRSIVIVIALDSAATDVNELMHWVWFVIDQLCLAPICMSR